MMSLLLSAFLYIKPIESRLKMKNISERFDMKGKRNAKV